MELWEIRERMESGRLYFSDNSELIAMQQRTTELLYDFNATRPSEAEKREQLLGKMLAEMGNGCYVEPPLRASWGGKNVHFGNGIYANFNLTLIDDGEIYIGDNVMIGPNVTICTATHPISPELRRRQAQYNLPVHIEENVWLGGGVFVMPGVTIGENSVIGANSVVTKDIPANVVAVGNPCRVLREITDDDRKFYDHGKLIDIEID